MVYRVFDGDTEIHTIYADSPLNKDDIHFLTIAAGNTENQDKWVIKEGSL